MADNLNQSHAFIGSGKIYLTPVKGGVRGTSFWVGVASAMTFSHSTENEKELREYHTGKNQVWDKYAGDISTTASLTIHERRDAAMAAALQATMTEVAADTVTGETHTFDAEGDVIFLKHKNVSNVVIKDSTTGTALDLVEGTDYTIEPIYGTIEMTHVRTLVSPMVVNYDYGVAKVTKPMTDTVDFYELRVNGLNTQGQGEKYVVTAPRAKITPADALDLISEDFAEMTIEAEILYDEGIKAPYQLEKFA